MEKTKVRNETKALLCSTKRKDIYMKKLIFSSLFVVFLLFACKTSDSSNPEASSSATITAAPTVLNESPKELTPEQQHQFDALVKQGDANYESGNFREALNFYKEARNIAPDQLGKSKLIACIKAMQEPSTRRADKK